MQSLDRAFRLGGLFTTEHWRDGKLINKLVYPNGTTNEGKNSILGVYFGGLTAPSQFHMGLINNVGYTALNAADTALSHAGWAEFTGYSQATRPIWTRNPAASQQVASDASVEFTINTSGVLRGGFIITNNTKGGTSGVLWATALYGATITVAISDVIRNTYTVTT